MLLACRRMDRMLSYMADGELEETHRARVERHLARCPQCQARLDAYRATKEAVREYQPIAVRQLHYARTVTRAGAGRPDRRVLAIAAAAMVLSLAAFIPSAREKMIELRSALPWDPGCVLGALPPGTTAAVTRADARTLVVAVQGRDGKKLAIVAFMRNGHLSPAQLTQQYGWAEARLTVANGRPAIEAWQQVAGAQGRRRLSLLAWNEPGYSVAIREEPAGSAGLLHAIAQGLKPGRARQMGELPRASQPPPEGNLLLAPQY